MSVIHNFPIPSRCLPSSPWVLLLQSHRGPRSWTSRPSRGRHLLFPRPTGKVRKCAGPRAQPANRSHGSRGRIPVTSPSASTPRGQCRTASLWGWTSITAYSHVEAVAARLWNDTSVGIGPLSLLGQPASPESTAFDHWESVQEEENKK